jgi:branched-subunit amino acid aminotransferase/4-amino-4-deoxychorismate lyase
MRIYRGFTRRILRDALLPLGLYREVELKVEEIEGKEIYCSNSLHGVVPVVEREGIPLTSPRRSAFLQRILEEALESLPEEGRMEKGWKQGI